jgi:hypothetical protein
MIIIHEYCLISIPNPYDGSLIRAKYNAYGPNEAYCIAYKGSTGSPRSYFFPFRSRWGR